MIRRARAVSASVLAVLLGGAVDAAAQLSRRRCGTGFTRPFAFVQDPSVNRVLQGPAYRGRYFSGRSDLAVWRGSSGTFSWLFAAGGFDYAAARAVVWGDESLGDRPLLRDFDGDRGADLTVWRASSGFWSWLTSSSGFSPAAAKGRQWGDAGFGDVPVVK